MSEIADRFHHIQARVAAAAQRVGRDPADISLIAVSKTWPVETLLEAYAAGARHFGENRAEELQMKVPELAARLGLDHGIVWHFIGHVQSRKSRSIVTHADYFHALDRVKLARRMSGQLGETGRLLPLLLEVNVSGEASKGGFVCDEWEHNHVQQENLHQAITEMLSMPNIELGGLMTMAPYGAPENEIRTLFRRTRLLRDWLSEQFPTVSWDQLSMGMTDDFEIGIEEGATLVRVGRAIFGSR